MIMPVKPPLRPPVLLSVRQAAARAHVAEQTVRNWCDRHLIHHERGAGGERLIYIDSLDAHAAKSPKRATPRARRAPHAQVEPQSVAPADAPPALAATPGEHALVPCVPPIATRPDEPAVITAIAKLKYLDLELKQLELQSRIDDHRRARRIADLLAVTPSRSADPRDDRLPAIRRTLESARLSDLLDDALAHQLIETAEADADARQQQHDLEATCRATEARDRDATIRCLLCAVTESLFDDGWSDRDVGTAMTHVTTTVTAPHFDPRGKHWPLHAARVVAYTALRRRPPPAPLIDTPDGQRPALPGD